MSRIAAFGAIEPAGHLAAETNAFEEFIITTQRGRGVLPLQKRQILNEDHPIDSGFVSPNIESTHRQGEVRERGRAVKQDVVRT